MEPLTRLILVLAINLSIFLLARYKRIFDNTGLAAAFAVGFVIGWFGALSWLALLLLFLFTGFMATRYKFALKSKLGVQEGKGGERRWGNVLATGLVPSLVALATWDVPGLGFTPLMGQREGALVFVSAIAVAASDTLASELGVLSEDAWLITTFERVKAGTDGGVSIWGEAWAMLASFYVAVIGYVFLYAFSGSIPYGPYYLLLPMAIGFIGCQIDSLLGATVEGKYFFGKHSVNLSSIAAGALIAWAVVSRMVLA